jgi:hypothetical protein
LGVRRTYREAVKHLSPSRLRKLRRAAWAKILNRFAVKSDTHLG